MMTTTTRSLLLTATAIGSALALSTTLGVNPASAGTATSNLTVSAAVNPSCSISTTPLAFGTYDPLGTSNVDGSGSVTTTCTTGASVIITLDQGANAAGGSTDAAPQRQMTNGASSYLSYGLYQDSGRSTVWGNTSGTGLAATGTGSADPKTVYGRIPSGQNVPAGSYSDTVVATVTF